MENNENPQEVENQTENIDNTIENKLFELDVRAQELEILLEQAEEKALFEHTEVNEDENYLKLKEQYKLINNERKQMKKELNAMDTSKLNQVSVWVIIYGSLTVLISFPIITGSLWLQFANIVIKMVSGMFSNLHTDSAFYNIVLFLVIFAFPLLLNLLTWLLYNNFVKSKTDKKVYITFWIIQGLMSLGMIIYMCTQLYGA